MCIEHRKILHILSYLNAITRSSRGSEQYGGEVRSGRSLSGERRTTHEICRRGEGEGDYGRVTVLCGYCRRLDLCYRYVSQNSTRLGWAVMWRGWNMVRPGLLNLGNIAKFEWNCWLASDIVTMVRQFAGKWEKRGKHWLCGADSVLNLFNI